MPTQYLYNPQSSMVPVQFTQGGTERSLTIPAKVTQEFLDTTFSPATLNLIRSGFLKLAGPPSVVEQDQPPVTANSIRYFGPWASNVRIGVGYMILYGGRWWLSKAPHITFTAPSETNPDFELLSDLSANQFPTFTPVVGDLIRQGASGWEVGKIDSSNISSIDQTKVSGLIDVLTSKLATAGGTMGGSLILSVIPPQPSHAIRRDFADAAYLAKTGGVISGPITWAGSPTLENHLATKAYVDTNSGISTSGGTMVGALALSSAVPGADHAIRRDFADATYITKTGGTLTGPLVLATATPVGLQAISKTHLDTFHAAGFSSGLITSTGTPVLATHLITKAYADTIDISGKAITTPITWVGTPTASTQLTPKGYVDTKISISGGTFLGPPIWADQPAAGDHLANKTYTDTKLATGGGRITGPVLWSGIPSDPSHLVNKEYVDSAGANNGLVKAVDGFGTRWILQNGVLENILEVGNNTASGVLRVFQGAFSATMSASLLSDNRTHALPDASGTLVLGTGVGADASFATGVGAQKHTPTTATLAAGILNVLGINTVGFTTNVINTYLIELGLTDGWNIDINAAPNAIVKFRLPHGSHGTLNGIGPAASAATAMSTTTVTAYATGFGASWNGWQLITTTSGASTGPIVVTTTNTSIAAYLTTAFGSNSDVTVTASIMGDSGNFVQYEHTGPIIEQYVTTATQTGTTDNPIITIRLAQLAQMDISGSLNSGGTPFFPTPHGCVTSTLKNGRVWYTSNGLPSGYTSEIFWNNGTARWNFAKGGFGTWVGTSGVTGDVVNPSLVPTWTASGSVTGTPTITPLSSNGKQVIASFVEGGITAATCALAVGSTGQGTSSTLELTALTNGHTNGTVTAKYFATDNHTVAELIAALAAVKAPIQLAASGTGAVTSLTLTLGGGSGIEPSFGGRWSKLNAQFSSSLSSYIVA